MAREGILSPPRASLAALPVRAVYTVGELARASGVSAWRLARLLADADVAFTRSGRCRLVSLSELRSKARPIWDAIGEAEALRRALGDDRE